MSSAQGVAGIGNIPETVASRSIKIAMIRRRKSQPIEKFRRRDVAQNAAPIVAALKAWSGNVKVIAALRAAHRQCRKVSASVRKTLPNRSWQSPTSPAATGRRGQRKALLHLRAKSPTDDDDIKIQLLAAIRETSRPGYHAISPRRTFSRNLSGARMNPGRRLLAEGY